MQQADSGPASPSTQKELPKGEYKKRALKNGVESESIGDISSNTHRKTQNLKYQQKINLASLSRHYEQQPLSTEKNSDIAGILQDKYTPTPKI